MANDGAAKITTVSLVVIREWYAVKQVGSTETSKDRLGLHDYSRCLTKASDPRPASVSLKGPCKAGHRLFVTT